MSKNPIEDRYEKRKKEHKLEELSRRTLSSDQIEAEEAAIAKAKEERAKDPEKYQLKSGEEIGRNDPCPCGSGKKYKKCCGAKAG